MSGNRPPAEFRHATNLADAVVDGRKDEAWRLARHILEREEAQKKRREEERGRN